MKLLSFMFLVLVSVQTALGSCGSATCPLHYHRFLTSGLLQVNINHEYINQDRIFMGTDPSHVGAVRYQHDEVQTVNRISVLQTRLGITERIGMRLDVPFIARNHSHIHHHKVGDDWETWNFSGVGDIEIGSQYVVLLPESESGTYLSAVAGLKLPTGLTTGRNSDGEKAEVSIQPGSGSVDGTFGLVVSQSMGGFQTLSGDYVSMPVTLSLSYRINGKGTDGWKFGNTVFAHVATSYQLLDEASLLFQMNGRFQRRSEVGTTGEPGENTGGSWVYISPGFEFHFLERVSAFAYVQIPVYQNVHGIQQTSSHNLQVGITTDIDLFAGR